MEYQNAGIRHIAIRKKDEIYDDFDPMFGEFYGATDKNESVQKDKESPSDSDNSDSKYNDKEKYSVSDIHKHKDRESSSDSDDEENYNNDKAKQKNRYSFSDSDDENSSNSENERTSDNETFRVSPQPNISEEEEQDEDERNDVDEDEMNLASLLNAVDEISISLKQKDEKSIHEQKNKFFREVNFNLDTRVHQQARRPSTSVHIHSQPRFHIVDNKTRRASSVQSRPISAPVQRPKSSANRLNVSFSNDKVRNIDLENQRLLKEIVKNKTKMNSSKIYTPQRKVSASAVNRAKKQQAIEQENLKFLKRLQSVKPTKALAKNTLLKDHMKNVTTSGRLSRTGRPVSAPINRHQTLYEPF